MPMDFLMFLAAMLRSLGSMQDMQQNDSITIADIRRHCLRGDILKFLEERGGQTMALDYVQTKTELATWYVREMAKYCKEFEDREVRKLGIEHRGLPFLMALTVEALSHPDRMDLL
jgi:hypothetical protein